MFTSAIKTYMTVRLFKIDMLSYCLTVIFGQYSSLVIKLRMVHSLHVLVYPNKAFVAVQFLAQFSIRSTN